MTSASTVRVQIEAALARRIPSALTPAAKTIRPVAPTGVVAVDELLRGGLPIGAVTEVVGPECSGRTAIALSFLAHLTRAGKACAWIDAGDTFDPPSAAAAGLDLERLLWVRCGVPSRRDTQPGSPFTVPSQYLIPRAAKKGLHGGGFGPHPRSEENGLSTAIETLFHPESGESQHTSTRCAAPPVHMRRVQQSVEPPALSTAAQSPARATVKPWSRIEQALRTADLLLQGGGFSAIVLDMGGLAPEFVSRVPLATWYRYRGAAARTQASIVLVTQYACAKSSAELVLALQPAHPLREEPTLFTGIRPHIQLTRRRFSEAPSNVIPLRKPPQSVRAASWPSRTAWVGSR